jgi:transcriptional regulator with XRE-family HTH domain
LERGLSQQKLADMARISHNYVYMVEAGAKSPSLRVLEAIAVALGRKPHELVKAAEDRRG